jgi:hypothetical protein
MPIRIRILLFARGVNDEYDGEGDGGGERAEGHHQGARAHRVLGQQDHLLHRPPLLPTGLLLDIQVLYTLCAVRCALCAVRCALCAVRCALCAVRCTL